MSRKRSFTALTCIFLTIGALAAPYADAEDAILAGRSGISHVLLISIDGMHAVDLLNCANGLSGVNGGKPYCPTLAGLRNHGVNYLEASTSRPSDSFPGLMALVTGGTPRTVGAYYDVAYDRVLAPPQNTTGNGLLGGSCKKKVANGTRTEYEEGIDLDQSRLNGGAPSGDGGVNSIDATRLPRDPFDNCNPVIPTISYAPTRFSA